MTPSQIAQTEYLKELDFTIIKPIIEGEVSLRGIIATDGVTFDTIISLPKQVPPSYPTFYLVDLELKLREPHVERPRLYQLSENDKVHTVCRTCIREERDKTYSSGPVDLLHYLYEDFLGLCSKIAKKEFDSKAEIFREFDSYWPNDTKVYWDIQGKPSDSSIYDMLVIKYDSRKEALIFIVTDRVDHIVELANISGWNITTRKRSMYFDIGDDMPFPLPYTIGDIAELFKKTGKIEQYKKLKKKIDSPFFFIGFNLDSGEKHFVNVWMNPLSENKVKKNNVAEILFSPAHRNEAFIGGHTESIDYARLMQRGGNSENSKLALTQKKVAIVGCGSIGSTIASKLLKSGIRDFILVDPSALKAGNIGRHQLGMSFINNNKAIALSKYLKSQFVGLNITPFGNEIESLNTIDSLRDVDLVITAIGSDAPSVEPWLANLVSEGSLPQMMTCWVEADGIAGHALYIKEGDKLNFDKTCDKISILDKDHAAKLLESEVGCNSIYMPYAFLDADVHINHMARFALSILKGEDKRAISSFGNIQPYKTWIKKDIKSWEIIEYADEILSL